MYLGIPKSEMALRGSTKIETLTPEEIEKMRVVCRVTKKKSIFLIIYFSRLEEKY